MRGRSGRWWPSLVPGPEGAPVQPRGTRYPCLMRALALSSGVQAEAF